MKKKRLLSLGLAAGMLLSLLPAQAVAAEVQPEAPPAEILNLGEATAESLYRYDYGKYSWLSYPYDGHPARVKENLIEVIARDGSAAPTWSNLKESGSVSLAWFDCNEDPLQPVRMAEPPVEPGTYAVYVEETMGASPVLEKLTDCYITRRADGIRDTEYAVDDYTFSYNGELNKIYDGEPVVFDPDQLTITETQTGITKHWNDLPHEANQDLKDYYCLTWVWGVWNNDYYSPIQAIDAPAAPGAYTLEITRVGGDDSYLRYGVAGFDFHIDHEATENADGTLRVDLIGLKYNPNNHYVQQTLPVGVLSLTADGTVTGLNQSGLQLNTLHNALIKIPDRVMSNGQAIEIRAIGEKAFYGKGFIEIVIPKTVETIGERAFGAAGYCERITVHPENLWFRHWEWKNELGLNSYQGRALCSRDLSCLICSPAGAGGDFHDVMRKYDKDPNHQPLREIAPYAFESSTLYESSNNGVFTLPDTLVSVGECAFLNFNGSMKGLKIGPALTDFAVSPMFGYALPSSLDTITVDPANTVYASSGGLLLNKAGTRVLYCPEGMTAPVVIPEGVTDIGDAFSGCYYLTHVTLPSTLTAFDPSQFSNATSLEGVAVAPGNPVYSVVDNALLKNGRELVMCPGAAETIQVPSSVVSIPAGALPSKYGITINITSPRIRFEEGALSMLQGARIVTGPGTILEYISREDLARGGVASIDIQHPGPKYASAGGMLTSADQKTLLAALRTGGNQMEIPDTIDTIATGAFTGGWYEDIALEHVKSIESGAFRRCMLGSVYISDELTSLGQYIIREPVSEGHKTRPVDLWYEGSAEQWAAIPGSNQLYDPADKPFNPYPEHGEGYPGEQWPPQQPFTVNVHHDARKLITENCVSSSFASVGDTVEIEIRNGKKASGWNISPSVEYTESTTAHGYPCITFTMPNSDLRVAPVFDVTEDIPIRSAALTLAKPVGGSTPGAAVSAEQDAHYTISDTSWTTVVRELQHSYPEDYINYNPGDPVTGPFAEGTDYMAKFTLTAKDGYTFGNHAMDYEVTVNGTEPHMFSASGKTMEITCLFRQLYPVTIVNGLSNGANLTYDPETNSSTAYFSEDDTIRAWPLFKENQVYGSMLIPGINNGTREGFGQNEEYFEPMRKEALTIEYCPSTRSNTEDHVIHVLHGEAYPGMITDTSGLNDLNYCRPGEYVTLVAATYPLPGYRFDHWVIYDRFNPNPDGVNPSAETPQPCADVKLHNEKAEKTWFTMPDHEIFAEAIFVQGSPRYPLYVEGGTIVSSSDPNADQRSSDSWRILPGATVTIAPENNPNAVFQGWKPAHSDVNVSPDYQLIMPQHDTSIYGIYEDITRHAVKVAGGMAIDANGNPVTTAANGDTLTLVPGETAPGEKFDGWESVRGNVSITQNTFTMGDVEVEVRAKVHTHSFGDWAQTADSHQRSCACGETQSEPHSFTDWRIDEAGENQYRTCTVCGYKDSKPVEKETHVHSVDESAWETDPAGHWHVCSSCGARVGYENHSFGAWTQEEGYRYRTCACGYRETVYTPVEQTDLTSTVLPDIFSEASAPVTLSVNADTENTGSVSYDTTAATAIAQEAGSASEIRLRVDTTADAVNHANPSQAESISNAQGAVVQVVLECLDSNGNPTKEISSFGGGLCAVKVPAPVWLRPEKGDSSAAVYRVEENGMLTAMKDVRLIQENGQWFVLWFSESHSLYMITEPDFYGRNTLSANEKQAYDLLWQNVAQKSEIIDFSPYELSPDALGDVMTVYLNDHPEHYWLRGGYRYSYSGSSVMSVCPNYESYDSDSEFEKQAAALLQAANGKGSDYAKALALHDALVKHVVYDLSAPHAHTAYGAIAEGRAVCEGYARAYQYLLQQVGIQSYVVTGTAAGGGHAWNLVRLNGKFYYSDPTWDDPSIGSMSNEEKPVFYAYFNLPESDITADHFFSASFDSIKPKADSRDMMYEGYTEVDPLNSELISSHFCKLNEEGTQLVSRVYYTGGNAGSWLRSSYADVAKAAHIQGGYSVRWLTCGAEVYLTYNVSKPQAYRPMAGQATKPSPERPTNGKFAQPSTTCASNLTNSVTINLMKAVKGGTCSVGIYNESGRLLTMGSATVSPGADRVVVRYHGFQPEEAKYMKVFLTDSQEIMPLYQDAVQLLTQ